MAFLKSLEKSAGFPLYLCVKKKEKKLIVMYHNVSKQNNFMHMGCLMGKYETKSQILQTVHHHL